MEEMIRKAGKDMGMKNLGSCQGLWVLSKTLALPHAVVPPRTLANAGSLVKHLWLMPIHAVFPFLK